MDSVDLVEPEISTSTAAVPLPSIPLSEAVDIPGTHPVKKPTRGAHACVRCKSRKQRCEGAGPRGQCTNCRSVGAECVFVPKPERKRRVVAPRPPTESHEQRSFTPTQPRPPPGTPASWTAASAPSSLSGRSFVNQPHNLPTTYSEANVFSLSSQPRGPDQQEMQVLDSISWRSDALSSSGSSADEGDSDEGQTWSDDAARGVAFLSLNASGSPIYVGPSSGFSWARIVLGGIASEVSAARPSQASSRHFPKEVINSSLGQPISFNAPPLPDDALESVPQELAEAVLSQCFRHVQPRYPFMDWLMVHEYWQHRDEITRSANLPNASKETRTAAFFIWMLFAIGSRLFYKVNVPSLAPAEAYYAKAMEHLDIILGLHDLKNMQGLLLMVMYSFRSNEAPSVWFLVGVANRVCLSLGLHRKLRSPRARSVSPYVRQLRSRIFWTTYTLDRMMAMSLGRPLGFQDRDIDIELPLDIDCVNVNPSSAGASTNGGTSMTSSIHLIKMRKIESLIQKHAYRVDRPTTGGPDELLRVIDEWEAAIPPEASAPNCWSLPCCSRDFFLMRAYEARLYLLRPLAVGAHTRCEPRHVVLLAQTAALACETQKRLHQNPTSSFSLESLRSTFLCGLTLLHAARMARSALSPSTLQRAIRATSNTIFSYLQHFPAAQAFHDAFEELAGLVLDASPGPTPLGGGGGGGGGGVAQGGGGATETGSTELWTSLLTDMPSMMNVDLQDDYTSLLKSLGIPVDDLMATTFHGAGAGAGPSLAEPVGGTPFARETAAAAGTGTGMGDGFGGQYDPFAYGTMF